MPLTAVQIDQLYLFTRQHYVEYYDLQTELVDHLAHAIEAQMKESPTLTFDEALNLEFQKFGIFGFMDVVENRQAVLNKKYNGLVWQLFKDFFGFPKIVFTLVLTLLIFSILKVSDYKEIVLLSLIGLLFIFSGYSIMQSRRQQKSNREHNKKKWLFEEIINQYGNFSVIVFVPFNICLQLYTNVRDIFINDFYLWVLSIVLVLSAVVLFILFKTIPAKMEDYLRSTYPEYLLEKS
ncbi:hypothetical protein [Flavobacterium muglaense]|uniref:Uncharacterized protein n=1 Tax=Flavobacterium muglaense TaxID=2764716 RepID=A0A923N1M1_9FLAO|nr:hypothetical protein [Flavobacterium muglaense]MBC5838476.1 hypothetical protein [Flavobacterium muglaense]MBC5844969.1 hypothetical protein [Flavobacterium muglaense]